MAIAFDSVGSARASVATLSYTHTVGASLSNTVAVAGVTIQDGNHAMYSVNSLTFGGIPMTLARRDEAVGNTCTFIYYCVNVAAGANTVSLTMTGGATPGEISCGTVVFSGVDQIFPIDAVNGATGNSSAPSVSLTTVADNCFTVSVVCGEASITAAGTQTVKWGPLTDQGFENAEGSIKGAITPAGATTLAYTLSSGQAWAISACSIQPVTGTTPSITLDATSSGHANSASSLTIAHTVGSLTNGLLWVGVGARDATVASLTVTGVTYNGVALTNIRSDLYNTSTFVRSENWYLKAPASGTHNIVISMTGSVVDVFGCGLSFDGVDQTTPIETNAGTGTITATSTTFSYNVVTSSNNDVLVTAFWGKSGDYISSPNAGNRVMGQYYDTTNIDLGEAQMWRVGNAGTYAMAYTMRNADGAGIGTSALKPTSGVAATTSKLPALGVG